MGRSVAWGLLALVALVFVVKPVTATTTDLNGTEVSGTCGPLWSMLAGSPPVYEDAAATNATDIGVTPDLPVVGATCQRNAVRRIILGGVVAGVAGVVVRRRRRASMASA